MKWSEVLSVVSSVASITGMSLLTANAMFEGLNIRQVAWAVAATLIVVLVGLGCIFGAVQAVLWGDRKCYFGQLRFVYWCFSGAFFIFISAILLIGCSYILSDALAIRFP